MHRLVIHVGDSLFREVLSDRSHARSRGRAAVLRVLAEGDAARNAVTETRRARTGGSARSNPVEPSPHDPCDTPQAATADPYAVTNMAGLAGHT